MRSVKSKAPLRLGLAGGGTDVSPYSDLYGGAILNATISLFAHACIREIGDKKIIFKNTGEGAVSEYELSEKVPAEKGFELAAGAYNRVMKDFSPMPCGLEISWYLDVPHGSGLGTSSTLQVAILSGLCRFFHIPLGKYELAHLAYEIERIDLGMEGGKQDQYAATFGGINFMEFFGNDKVIVNPLGLSQDSLLELEESLLLIYTQRSRNSSDIIREQIENVKKHSAVSVEAMHRLKKQSIQMKEALLRGEYEKIGKILHEGWIYKKQMASNISNSQVEAFYETALQAGALGGKISGAGGGGYMFFFVPAGIKMQVAKSLTELGGIYQPFSFCNEGVMAWETYHT